MAKVLEGCYLLLKELIKSLYYMSSFPFFPSYSCGADSKTSAQLLRVYDAPAIVGLLIKMKRSSVVV